MAPTRRTFWSGAAIVVADQATKWLAHSPAGAHLPFVEPASNARLSLGLLGGDPVVLGILSAAGLIVAAVLLARRPTPAWATAAVLGGAASNLADRVVLGSVRDFMALPVVVANVADLAVIAGLVGVLFARRRGEEVLT